MFYILTGDTMTDMESEEKIFISKSKNPSNIYVNKIYRGYETLEEAEKEISKIFGEVHELEDTTGNQDILSVYKEGKYEELDASETGDWVYEPVKSDVKANSTDEELKSLAEKYEEMANELGGTLDSCAVEEAIELRRKELQEKEEE
jgi:hypothetical protein